MLAGVVAGWAWGYGLDELRCRARSRRRRTTSTSRGSTGFGVAAILYYVLRPFFSKEAAAQAATTS